MEPKEDTSTSTFLIDPDSIKWSTDFQTRNTLHMLYEIEKCRKMDGSWDIYTPDQNKQDIKNLLKKDNFEKICCVKILCSSVWEYSRSCVIYCSNGTYIYFTADDANDGEPEVTYSKGLVYYSSDWISFWNNCLSDDTRNNMSSL